MKSILGAACALALFLLNSHCLAQHYTSTPNDHTVTDHAALHGRFQPRPAPSWQLVDFNGDLVNSDSFLGKPGVILFFLGHTCLHCSEQLQTIGKRVGDLEEAGVNVIAVSTDSVKGLARSVEQYDGVLPFKNILADEKHQVFQDFGVFDREQNRSLHATVIFDAKGIIRWQNIGHEPFMDTAFIVARAKKLAVTNQPRIQQQEPVIKRPKVFLGRSERIVNYQLGRLDNEQLLLVERATTDKKYLPVYKAILSRSGMSRQYRNEAINAIAIINATNPVAEIVNVLDGIKLENRQSRQTSNELAKMLVEIPASELKKHHAALLSGRDSKNEILKSVSYAALTIAGSEDQSWDVATSDSQKLKSWLESISHIASPEIKSAQRDKILNLVATYPDNEIRSAAIRAVSSIPGKESETFSLLAKLASEPSLREAAVDTLLKIPASYRDERSCRYLAENLTAFAEKTPAAERTSESFSKAVQLADQAFAKLPSSEAKILRDRLDKVSVRVIRILTIEDEMRYDIPFFAVEAGRPVQVVLENDDFVSHNLVITKPGALKEVAALGLAAGPNNGVEGKAYVPKSDLVLQSTNMVAAYQHEALTFTAPNELGNYPYVCTFPQHWPRMYGVMVVVKDLDAWLKNPVPPKDPIGSNRKFVQSWTVGDLKDDLDSGVQGRSNEIGKRIFSDATCLQCHQLNGEGGAVGPDLSEVVQRFKGNREDILREILEPSHKIDEKYSMHLILILDGETITGIIQSQDDEKIELIDNPESKVPRVVMKDDIDEMVKTSKSIMPKALLDRFTRDEILELMAYIEANQK